MPYFQYQIGLRYSNRSPPGSYVLIRTEKTPGVRFRSQQVAIELQKYDRRDRFYDELEYGRTKTA